MSVLLELPHGWERTSHVLPPDLPDHPTAMQAGEVVAAMLAQDLADGALVTATMYKPTPAPFLATCTLKRAEDAPADPNAEAVVTSPPQAIPGGTATASVTLIADGTILQITNRLAFEDTTLDLIGRSPNVLLIESLVSHFNEIARTVEIVDELSLVDGSDQDAVVRT